MDSRAGTSLSLMARAGHRSMSTTKGYLHLAVSCSVTKRTRWNAG